MPKEKKTPTVSEYSKVTTLIESVKKDNLTQFGEVKKEFGGITSTLELHSRRLTMLEEDKIKRDAIEQYKKDHPEVAAQTFKSGQEAYNESTGTITVNKELLTALKYLGLVVAALAAAILAMKVKT